MPGKVDADHSGSVAAAPWHDDGLGGRRLARYDWGTPPAQRGADGRMVSEIVQSRAGGRRAAQGSRHQREARRGGLGDLGEPPAQGAYRLELLLHGLWYAAGA